MIVNVTVSCPDCRLLRGIDSFDIRSTGLFLTLYDFRPEANFYTFFCPHCYAEVNKPADETIVSLLLGYVQTKLIHVPLELVEDDRSGPPLTPDDLIDLIMALYQGELRVPDAVYEDAARKAKALTTG